MEPLIENFDLQDEIIRYLNGEMDDRERSEFETKVQNDTVLAAELQNYRTIMNGIEHWGDSNLKDLIAQVDNQLEQELFFKSQKNAGQQAKVSKFVFPKKFAIAAAFVGLVLFAFLLVYLNRDSGKNSKLYAEFYQVDQKTSQTVLSQLDPYGFIPSNLSADSLQWALDNYLQGNYKAALSVFGRCADEEGIQNLCRYYSALSYLGLKEEARAMKYFDDLCALPNHELRMGSCWYFALTLIKLNDKDPRIPALLREVSQTSESPFAREATNLLSKWTY